MKGELGVLTRLGSSAYPTFNPWPHAFRALLHEPAFNLHDPMDRLDIDSILTAAIQCPMNGSDACMRLLIDDGPDFLHKAFIEPVAASFLRLPIKG